MTLSWSDFSWFSFLLFFIILLFLFFGLFLRLLFFIIVTFLLLLTFSKLRFLMQIHCRCSIAERVKRIEVLLLSMDLVIIATYMTLVI